MGEMGQMGKMGRIGRFPIERSVTHQAKRSHLSYKRDYPRIVQEVQPRVVSF